MKKEFSKIEAKEIVEKFFSKIKEKNPKEIKKIKKIVMSYKISLNNYKVLFCNKCFSIYKNPIIRIKKGMKIIKCKNCGNISRKKLI